MLSPLLVFPILLSALLYTVTFLDTSQWVFPSAAGRQKRFLRRKAVVSTVSGILGAAAPPAQAIGVLDDIPAPADVKDVPADAQTTASGLAFKVLQPPKCKGALCQRPGATDKVEVDYTGWQRNGKMFDSSVKRGERSSFYLNEVIPGWTEGLQLMTPGEKRRFWIPAALAYGEKPTMRGAPAGPLVFDVELYGVSQDATPEQIKKYMAQIEEPLQNGLVRKKRKS